MNTIYHVSKPGLSPGTILVPGYYNYKEKISIFVRACCQGPEVFIATLTSAQYTDEIFNSLLNRRNFAGASRWATEGLFEFVRWFHYPDRPERYGCIYGFESIDLAAGFIEKHRKEEGHSIYKCACDPTAPVFRTDMDLFTEVSDLIINGQVQVDFSFENLFPKLLAIAKSYWQGPQNLRYPEILIKGSIQVLEQLT